MKKRVMLINARKSLGLTQLDLAETIGISRAYLSNIENGKHRPSLQVALNLSAELKQDVRLFFC